MYFETGLAHRQHKHHIRLGLYGMRGHSQDSRRATIRHTRLSALEGLWFMLQLLQSLLLVSTYYSWGAFLMQKLAIRTKIVTAHHHRAR